MIDAGFLELARLGELSPTDPDILASLPVVDATIRSDTASGPGWHRYNGDGYGDRTSDGRPWAPSGVGTGHLWPALSSERAEQSLQTGDAAGAASLLDGMDRFAGGVGLIPEQDWEAPDLAPLAIRDAAGDRLDRFRERQPGGLRRPAELVGGVVRAAVRRTSARARSATVPSATFQRYVAHTQGRTPLTVTSPADLSAVSGSPVTVAGTTAPGNLVYVTATNTDANSATTTASTTADAAGAFSVDVAVTGGTTVLNVVAVAASGGTAHVKRTVVFDFVPGTLLLDVPDPTGDDNGPGNYAYPTSSGFHPGAFDLQRVPGVRRRHERDLPGEDSRPVADLRQPARRPARRRLCARSRRRCGLDVDCCGEPSRNFQIAPAYAWSRLIQVQGFGQRYENAAGTTLGTVAISANQISRFITFRVPKASLGTPGPGWAFTVVLTGQDGFSGDQARGFQPTPQDFQFGVCATSSRDPHCTFDPGAVPKAIDVIRRGGRAVRRARLHAAQPGGPAGRRDSLRRVVLSG